MVNLYCISMVNLYCISMVNLYCISMVNLFIFHDLDIDFEVTRNGNILKLNVKCKFSLRIGLMLNNHINPIIQSIVLK